MRGGVYAKIGLVLIATSCGLWAAVLFVPILPLAVAEKALTVTSLFIISEVFFWLGILLAGKELAHYYRQKLNPLNWWRRITNRR